MLIAGEHDYSFPPNAMQQQMNMFSDSQDKSLVLIEEVNHVAILGNAVVNGHTSAERCRLTVPTWLIERGY